MKFLTRILTIAFVFCLGVSNGMAQVANPAGYSFGSVALGQSASTTVTFQFTGPVTVASVAVLTQGVSGKDFQATTPDTSGTLCTAGTYATGDACTVDITFAPLAPGQRLGAAVLRDSSNRILATGYVEGFGSGAQLGFSAPSVSTFVGTGTYSLTNPSGQTGTSAGFLEPYQIAFDGSGNMYMADLKGEMIYKITPAGLVSTLLGTYRTSCGSNYTCGYPTSNSTMPASSASVYSPQSILVDGAGLLWFVDSSTAGLATIDLASGYVTAQVPGTGTATGAPATSGNIHTLGAASLGALTTIATDGLGNMYVGAYDYGSQSTAYAMILKLDTRGNISVFAGNTTPFYGNSAPADGTQANNAVLGVPWGMGFDGSGNFYYFDQVFNQVFKIDTAGKVHPFAGSGSTASDNTSALPYWQSGTPSTTSSLSVNFANAVGMLAVDPSGNVFLPSSPSSYSDTNSSSRVFVFTPTGYAYVLAGTGSLGETNGPASSSELAAATSIALNGTGDVYVSEKDIRQSGASPAVYVGSSVRKWSMAASTLSFGSQPMGSTSAGQTVTATNIGNAPLVLTRPSSGTNPATGASFALLSNTAFNGCAVGSSGSVAVNLDCSVIAAFEPHQSSGSISGNLIYTGNLPGGTTSVPMTGTATPGVASLKLTGLPASATSGAANTVSVSALDINSNLFPTYTGTIHFSLSPADAAATLPSDYTFTSGDSGTKTFSVTLSAAGAHTLTVSDTANGLSAAQNTTVVSAVNHLAFTLAPPVTATVGTSFQVTVTAYSSTDSSQIATSYTGPVKFTSSDSSAVLPTSGLTLTNGAGTFSITLNTVGAQTITVADSSGSPSVTSGSITVSPAVPVTGAITTTNLSSNLVTLNLSATASGTGYFTLLSGSNATCGTAAQTVAGQDSSSNPVIHGSVALTANVASAYTVRNLSGSTAYTVCFAPNNVTAPVSASLTTTAPVSLSNAAWTGVGAAGFSAGGANSSPFMTGNANYISLAFSPTGEPYVAYEDGGNSNKATVMMYNGTSWVDVGSAGFSAGSVLYTSLAFSPSGQPYVAYEDNANGGKATVMMYNGTSWVDVGSAGFSAAGGARYVSLAFSPSGQPYVAYEDYGNSTKATVMMYNGTSWVNVGSAGFSAGEANATSLAFSPSGQPYVAYEDYAYGGNATVMMYNGTSWVDVGNPGFSASASSISFAFSPSGEPYVAYEDGGSTNRATVMMYNGTSWADVGSADFTPAYANFASLAFSPSGVPYMEYSDSANGGKATVVMYNGTSWVDAGSAGFSAGGVQYMSLAFSPTGQPYVAYEDNANNSKATVMAFESSGPTATTSAATGITASAATLNGTVNDNGSATTVSFDYGTTTSYGTNVAATTPTGGSIAAGTGSTAVAVNLTGLTPNTTYHFRVDATANGTTVNGSDATFTTSLATPTITTAPTASGITYGQTLASSTLTGGAASYNGTAVPGTFAWTTPTEVASSGTASYSVTFTPTNTTEYATATTTVSVTATYVVVTATVTTTNLSSNLVTLNLTASASGTGYFTLLSGSNATCGTATQTVAGQDSNSNPVIHGSLTVTANVASAYTVRNLSGSTAYTVCFTPDGLTAPVSASLTTTAPVSLSNAAWTGVGAAGFSAGGAYSTSLAFSPTGAPYVAYRDGANNYAATVMMYNGTSWVDVGTPGFSVGTANFLSLAFSPSGQPYVAYQDGGNGGKATVMMYNGTSWVDVGSAGISTGTVTYPSLAFSPSGEPYVAYEDTGNSNTATVMMYNGSAWVDVGSAGFSAGGVYFTSLAFSPSGEPYVAYEDTANGGKATVMMYNGSAWVDVGSAGFSAGTVYFTSLAFSPTGVPYVAYEDGGNNYAATVMTYDGTSWVDVGTPGISAGTVTYPSLAFSPTGVPYVAYTDGANNNKATVMMSIGTSWVDVGSAGFSAGGAIFTSLAFSPTGAPYVAYSDGANNSKATVMFKPSGPTATTAAATGITASAATLNGTVNDNGSATTVSFDYGTTTSYGTNVAATTGGSIAAGTGNTAVAVNLTGLTPNTTYHFRVDATANGTTVNGSDATFTTSQATPTITVASTGVTYGVASASLSASVAYTAAVPTGAFTFQVGTGSVVTATCTGSSSPLICTASYPTSTLAVGSYIVTGTLAADTTYTTASNTATLTVGQATPTITTVPTASGITYGQTLASSTLTGGVASYNGTTVAGTFSFSAPTTAPGAGTASYAVTFTPTNTTDYTTATTTVSVTTAKATPTITTVPTASAITYGQALASSTLTGGVASFNGTAVAGTFTFSAPTTAPGAGTASYAVTFTPTNATDYTTATTTVSVVTNPATQSIVFTLPTTPFTYGSATTVSLSATGGASGNPVTYAVISGPGSVVGSVLSILGAGTIRVTATELGNANYAAATPVTQTLVVNPASVALTGPTAPVAALYGQSTTIPVAIRGQFSGTGITPPTGSLSYALLNSSSASVASGSATITNGSASIPVPTTLAPGNYSVSVTFPGNTDYAASATALSIGLQIGQIQPVATITAPGAVLTYGAPLGISATATYNGSAVAGSFSYSATPAGGVPSAVTATTVLPAGSYSLTANFTPSNATNYKTATASSMLTVNKATAGISLTTSANTVLVQNPVTFTATVASVVGMPTGTVSFFDGSTTSTPIGAATLTNGVAVLTSSTLAIGTHTITAVYSGDGNFVAATSPALLQTVQDFNLTISTTAGGATTATVVPGGTANYVFTLSPTGATTFPANVALSVSGLPTGATYTLSPTSIQAGSGPTNVTLTVQVPNTTMAALRQTNGPLPGRSTGKPKGQPWGRGLAPIALGVLLLPFTRRMRKMGKRMGRAVTLALLLMVGLGTVAGLSGCGTTTGYFGQAQHTYTVSITGTSGALVHSTTVTLNVQ